MKKTIQLTYSINVPVADVWRALVDPEWINEWGGGPAKMDDQVGTKFKLWGGDIHGTNMEITPEQKLIQHWYSGKWPEPSVATFELKKDGRRCLLTLTHEQVPETALKEIEEGWREYYLGPLQGFVEQRSEFPA